MDPTVYVSKPTQLSFAYVKCIGRSAVCAKVEPSAALTEYVDYIWYINWPWSGSAKAFDRFIPTGRYELIFNLGASVHESMGARNWVRRPDIFVVSPREKYVLVNPSGNFFAVGVVFKAGKINAFLENGSFLSNRQKFIPKHYLYKDPTYLLNLLKGDTTILRKMHMVNNYLADCLIEDNVHSCFIDYATKRIYQCNGNITIKEIAEAINCSERHLHRKFKERVGISPKSFTQIIKVNAIIEEMLEGNSKCSEIAFKYGFFDQTHFNKTFKKLVGLSPNRFLTNSRGVSQYLQFHQSAMQRTA